MTALKADEHWMKEALKEAQKAEAIQEVPVGAVIVKNNQIIARGFNQVILQNDPTAHAEVVALRKAAEALGNYRLVDSEMYITLEPCMMCLGAMVHARVKKVHFATKEPKAGVICSHLHLDKAPFLNHQIEVESGVLEAEAAALLKQFFYQRRQEKKNS